MADAPDILSPITPARPDAQTARALIARLVRGGVVSPDLLALMEGKLATAVAGSTLARRSCNRAPSVPWSEGMPTPQTQR